MCDHSPWVTARSTEDHDIRSSNHCAVGDGGFADQHDCQRPHKREAAQAAEAAKQKTTKVVKKKGKKGKRK